MNRFAAILILFLIGCRAAEEKKGTLELNWEESEKVEISYAKGFTIDQLNDFYRITIIDPQNEKLYGTYILYPSAGEIPVTKEKEIAIPYPIKTFASVSNTHLPFLKLLNKENSLTGFAGQKFVVDPDFKSLFIKNSIKELGADNNLNNEKLIELMPDLLMVYPFGTLNFDAIAEAGIPVFYNTDYLENHPLGKTEWIKVFGLLYGKESSELANKKFTEIESRYNAIKEMGDTLTIRPNVFTGTIQSGTWYVPGGNSYQAIFLKDAGTDYVWKDDEHNNSLGLQPEEVIDLCIDADYWVLVAAENENFGLEKLGYINPIYKAFKAFRHGGVIFCNSNFKDYFGMAIVEPDVILSELFMLMHPELFRELNSLKYFDYLK